MSDLDINIKIRDTLLKIKDNLSIANIKITKTRGSYISTFELDCQENDSSTNLLSFHYTSMLMEIALVRNCYGSGEIHNQEQLTQIRIIKSRYADIFRALCTEKEESE
jgi:hypothetical protein